MTEQGLPKKTQILAPKHGGIGKNQGLSLDLSYRAGAIFPGDTIQ